MPEPGSIEEIRKAWKESSEKLEELEKKVKKLERISDISSMIEINWRIAHMEAFAQRLLSSARNAVINLPRFEEGLKEYFEDLSSLLKILEERGWPINWDLVRKSTSIILHAAKEIGLPFRVVADLVVEKLGKDAAKVFSEKEIEEAYGLTDLDLWKKILRETF